MNKLNIAYSCNEAYIQHTGISMLSLFENNKDFDEIDVYFITKDVSDESILLLQELTEKYQRKLIIIPFEKLCSRLKINNMGRHIETVYSKLFFSQLEGIDKILYLDSDTIVDSSLESLWEKNIEEYLVAGVRTFTIDAIEDLGLKKNDILINDGIVLMNLNKFRKLNIEDKFVKSIEVFNGEPPILSEGILNLVCRGKILALHPKYNLMSGFFDYKKHMLYRISDYYSNEIIDQAIKTPIIIHYLSALYGRPWFNNCTHPLKNKYLLYKSMSYWKDVPLLKNKIGFKSYLIKVFFSIFPSKIIRFVRGIKNKYKWSNK